MLAEPAPPPPVDVMAPKTEFDPLVPFAAAEVEPAPPAPIVTETDAPGAIAKPEAVKKPPAPPPPPE